LYSSHQQNNPNFGNLPNSNSRQSKVGLQDFAFALATMSIGFSLSDFLPVIGLAWKTYCNARNTSREFYEGSREIGSLYATLEAL
jgi:hypothetical protein